MGSSGISISKTIKSEETVINFWILIDYGHPKFNRWYNTAGYTETFGKDEDANKDIKLLLSIKLSELYQQVEFVEPVYTKRIVEHHIRNIEYAMSACIKQSEEFMKVRWNK